MDYAGALATSMIIVFAMGGLAFLVGDRVYYSSNVPRRERFGLRLKYIGGLGFVFLAMIGWMVSIWLGFAQKAGAM